MTVLIELYDREEPLNNVLSLTVLKPDVLVTLGSTRVRKERCRMPIERYIASLGLQVQTEYLPCRVYDLDNIREKLAAVIARYGAENCVIDVLGGSDTMLMAVGFLCQAHPGLQVVTQKARANELVWLWGPQKGGTLPLDFTADVRQMVSLAGGEMVRHGHTDGNAVSDELLALIPRVFSVYMRRRRDWNEFVLYLQQLNKAPYVSPDGVTLTGPMSFQLNRRRVDLDLAVLTDLEEAGAVTELHIAGRTAAITFASAELLRHLCVVGAWLELFVYATLKGSGLFRAVEISTVVSWDDDKDKKDVINELDVIALDGLGQLFISCKTNVPDNSVLNEIATLTERFGARYAVPVLVTACDMERDAASVLRRAGEMGVAIIDADDLTEEKLLKRVKALRRRWSMH